MTESHNESSETRHDILQARLNDPEERRRLYRFCYRLAGDGEVAEDLTQEALLEAWRQRDTLQKPEFWRSWLHGIARNMYLRWRRSHGREMARRVDAAGEQAAQNLLEAQVDPSLDLHLALERYEIAHLLGRALGSLPDRAREPLVLHYVDEMPHPEIAARLGVSENTAAVRLHRGKQSLRRILTERFYAEATAFGILPGNYERASNTPAPESRSRETHLWCPFCGAGPLFYAELGGSPRFSCPKCYFVLGPRRIDYPSDCIFGHEHLNTSALTETVRGYRPMIKRIARYWGSYLHRGRDTGTVTCVGCGASLGLSAQRPAHLQPRPHAGFHIHCSHCRKIHVLLPAAFAFTTKPAQEFWQQNPRMRLLPSRPVPGENAFIVPFESMTSGARLEIIFRSDDYRVLESHRGPK
ncbi:MAG: hypothetical protein OHK0029_00190 [Armatimonadaceae bacterium]